MNAPFVPTDGLTAITTEFDSLGDEAKLLLIDHLCGRAGFDLNFYALAFDWAMAHSRTVEEAEATANRLTAVSNAERTLRYYLRADRGRVLAFTPVRGEAA